jgi:hypothetical protein
VSVRASALARKLARKQAGYEDVDDETGGIDHEEGTVAGENTHEALALHQTELMLAALNPNPCRPDTLKP